MDLENIKKLANYPFLKEFTTSLDLRRTDTNDQVLSDLATVCENLEKINLYGLREITDLGLEKLAKANPKLQHVNLAWCSGLTGQGINSLAKACRHLTTIDLCQTNDKITNEDLETFLQKCNKLESLSYSSRSHVTDKIFESLGMHTPKLQQLYISCKVTDLKKYLKTFAKGCQNLKEIELFTEIGNHFDDEELKILLEGCQQIEILSFPDSKISDEGLKMIALKCPNLQKLTIDRCFKITEKGIDFIKNASITRR